jgi:DNA-binding CsgD family transcriptional regulator
LILGVFTLPNIFAEIVLAALRFAALWVLFNLLHKSRTRLRFVMAVCVMALQFPLCRVLFFASGGNSAASVVCDVVLFLCLAFICEGEASADVGGEVHGDLARPVISAMYFNGMLQLINYVMLCFLYAFYGKTPPSFSLQLYFWKTVEGGFLLLWTLFYYRFARNMTVKAPLPFSLLTIFTPLAAVAVITASAHAFRPLLDSGTRLFLYGGIFGVLIIALNMCVFYLYTKLSVAHESLVFAQNLSQTPPVWTPEHGFSAAFIEKYEITPREREVIEILLAGKTDKEIALALNIAVNTVQVHLKRIYRRTGAAGRFALSALIRGK